ncbi:MAG TPA: branched-chain amino acid ABC transporter permease [Amycolatopsis sp.]|nr:branched-chain amino acid ABC transporter permease [Amycolatopsis sp.]
MLATRTARSASPWAVCAIVLLATGLSGDQFLLSVATTTILWVVLAGGLNLMMGYGGLANLGIGASYGIGAYAAGLVATRTGLPLVAAFAVAILAAAIVAAVIAPFVLRTRGLHFAIATLAIGIVATDLFTNLAGLTGGSVGLSGISRPDWLADPAAMYWFAAAIGFLLLVLFAVYHRSRMALVLRGVRDDEQLTRSLGFAVTRYKITAFVLGSACAGLAGALYAYFIQYVAPSEFALAGASFQAFAIVAFGGAATVWGPSVGAILLTGLPTFVDLGPQAKMAAYGLALLIVVLAVPEGVVPGAVRLSRLLRHQFRQRSTPVEKTPSGAETAPLPETATRYRG